MQLNIQETIEEMVRIQGLLTQGGRSPTERTHLESTLDGHRRILAAHKDTPEVATYRQALQDRLELLPL